ncbi:MAG: DUF58 domain-containing protein [Lentisphaeria bacterium]|nr:DUF58 domain-containing protein [Lentisphaeria bacterium]
MAANRYLDLNVLARIDSMHLLARTVVEGFLLGLHRSPFRGFSVEFAEYRQYTPGDEVKHIDWKVYAKTDRYYIKQFEEETNLACTILLDASASMAYRSDDAPFSKLEYGCRLAACLAYFMNGQRDPTGLAVFDTGIRTMLPPSLRQAHLQRLLTELDQTVPGGETNVAAPLHSLAESLRRRGMIILISDLLDDTDAVLSALQHFRFLGHDVLVLQVMDNAELTFRFTSMTEFSDLETGATVLVSAEGMRTTYLEELGRFLRFYEKGCAAIRADYKLFDTATPLEIALSEYLYRRSLLG